MLLRRSIRGFTFRALIRALLFFGLKGFPFLVSFHACHEQVFFVILGLGRSGQEGALFQMARRSGSSATASLECTMAAGCPFGGGARDGTNSRRQ